MHKYFYQVIFFCLFPTLAMAQDDTLVIGKNYSLKSTILNEERPYSVYLPEGCELGGKNAPCPVLYILDGNDHFHYASGMIQRMAINQQIPEMIMVAIPNTKDRTRDLTPTYSISGFKPGEQSTDSQFSGGGNAFLDFLEQELLPEVQARYQPMPFRILSGHSLGGLMALHSFIERPTLFQAHIAIDSSLWWDNKELIKRAEKRLPNADTIRNRVYVAIAEHGPKGEMESTAMETVSERFFYALKTSSSPNLKSGFRQFMGESHNTVTLPSLYYGLLFVFEGYSNIPPAVTSQGLNAVVAYYRDYLSEYGIQLMPPLSAIVGQASIAEANNQLDMSLEYLRYNLEKHPDAFWSHYSLAMFYKRTGQVELAKKHFKKSLALEPAMEAYINPELRRLTKALP